MIVRWTLKCVDLLLYFIITMWITYVVLSNWILIFALFFFQNHILFFKKNIFWILGLHVLTYDLGHNSKNKRMSVKSNITLSIVGHLYTSSISYMEPVHYDRQSLHHQHRKTVIYIYVCGQCRTQFMLPISSRR
jgi:hypothetical protein